MSCLNWELENKSSIWLIASEYLFSYLLSILKLFSPILNVTQNTFIDFFKFVFCYWESFSKVVVNSISYVGIFFSCPPLFEKRLIYWLYLLRQLFWILCKFKSLWEFELFLLLLKSKNWRSNNSFNSRVNIELRNYFLYT